MSKKKKFEKLGLTNDNLSIAYKETMQHSSHGKIINARAKVDEYIEQRLLYVETSPDTMYYCVYIMATCLTRTKEYHLCSKKLTLSQGNDLWKKVVSTLLT